MNSTHRFQHLRAMAQRLSTLPARLNDEVVACDVQRSVALTHAAHKTSMRVARGRKQVAAWTAAASLSLLSGVARADTESSFTAITKIMQSFVDFMTGPFGKAAVVISIVAAFVTWVFAPKEGIFGPVLRVVVAGIAIMNAAAWITNFGTGGKVTLN